MIDFSLFDRMARLRSQATVGPWYISPKPEADSDEDDDLVTIGTHEGDHYEETVANFPIGEFDGRANAEFVAFVADHAEAMLEAVTNAKRVIDAARETISDGEFLRLAVLFDDLTRVKGFKVIKPCSDEQSSPAGNLKLFLAGSIDNGTAEDWQVKVEEQLSDLPVTVYNPRRDDWQPDLRQSIEEPEFAYQVNWELDNIEAADVLFFYFSPGGPAPITLMELGKAAAKGDKLIVCCPDGYWRKGNVEVLCHRHGIPLYDNLEGAILGLRHKLEREAR